MVTLFFQGLLWLSLLGFISPSKPAPAPPTQPNIILIYLDDLGYGDMGAYGAKSLKTPNMDRLAHGGVRFTHAYATSSTCTPSRYGLLTGIYPWRNKDAKILPGTAPLLITTDQMTLPKMLKTKGYATGVVGKWHLGLGDGQMDWNQPIKPGPNELGFDYSFIMAATQDRVPTVYVQNGKVVGLDPSDPIQVDYDRNFPGEPTGKDNPELTRMKWHHGHNNSIINGIPRIGFSKGGKKAHWVDENMADDFLLEAKNYIQSHSKKANPFFLMYAMQQPHVPRTPHPRFVGKSGMGPRGDVILEADWCVGELLKTLEAEGILENTMIIFSSDNGPVLNDGYYDEAVELLGDHLPAGPLRGGKYSLFEAGPRVPFMVYWKGTVQPKVSNALYSQVDLLSSIAALVGSPIRGQDSQALPNTLLGKTTKGRSDLLIEATMKTAMRQGNYVYIPAYKGQKVNELVNIELGNDLNEQVYDVVKDPGQKQNLAQQNPALLAKLKKRYEVLRGPAQGTIEPLELK